MSGSVSFRVSAVDLGRAMQKADLMETAAVTAIAQGVVRDSEPFVPMSADQKYHLRETAEIESGYGSGKVRYGNASVPYAAPQYNAPGGWNYTTPGTGPRWFDEAQAMHMKQWLAEGKAAVKEVAGK